MREIKFKALEFFAKTWIYWNIYDQYPSDSAGFYAGLSEPLQYIGIKDKNGVEIYEGDILNEDFVVEF